MSICRDKLYYATLSWLPDEQTLSEKQIRQINEYIISIVGDDETKYAEILCKSLEANARRNKVDALLEGEIKREKTDQVELEYYQTVGGAGRFWDDYIKELQNICPIFGYNKPFTVGIRMSAGKVPTYTDCDLCIFDEDPFFLDNCDC